jgi:RNA ligase
MREYPKINTIWKRDARGRIVEDEYATPELAYLADLMWDWTEKVNGTNTRIGWDAAKPPLGDFEISGRTADAQIPAKLIATLRELIKPELLRAAFDDEGSRPPGHAASVTLYGEGYGAGIQKGGGNYSDSQTFVLFDVVVDEWWLSRENVADVARKLDLRVVPSFGQMTLKAASDLVKSGPLMSTWGAFAAEGLVGRPAVDLHDRRGDRIMAKIKTRDFRP